MKKLLIGIGLLALFLGWNAPNHYPPWPAFHLELLAALGVCFLAAAVLWPGAPQAQALPMPWATRGWLLLGLWPLAQWVTGQVVFRGDAALGWLYTAGAGLSVYVGCLWAAQLGTARVLRSLFATFVAGGLVAGGLALLQWLRLDSPGWWAMELIDNRPYANFAQPNHLGLLMVMAMVATTALYESMDIRRRWVWALAMLFFGWGVLISESRASMLALFVLAGLWLLSRGRVNTRLRPWEVGAMAAAGLLLGLAIEPLQRLLLLSGAEFRAVADAGPRQLIWLHFGAAILQHPWLGYGFNQSVQALAEVAAQVQPSRNVIYAHNVVLDLMTWGGVPLALVCVGALVTWLAPWWRKQGEPAVRQQHILVLAMWSALLVQSLLEFPFAHTYFLLPAALLVGAVTAPPRPESSISQRYRASAPALLLMLATGALLVLTAAEYFRIETDFRFNRFQRVTGKQGAEATALDQPWVLDQLAALNATAHYVIGPHMPPEQLQNLGRVAHRFHILTTRLDYAKALALNGRLGAADAELQVIRSVLHPALYRPIDDRWRDWLRANAEAIDSARAK